MNGFARVPDQILEDPTLSLSAVRLFMHFARHLWKRGDACSHSDRFIAQETGLGLRTIVRARPELVARGHIQCVVKFMSDGGRRVYTTLNFLEEKQAALPHAPVSFASGNAKKDEGNAKKDSAYTSNDPEPLRENQIPPPIPARGGFFAVKGGRHSGHASETSRGKRSAIADLQRRFVAV